MCEVYGDSTINPDGDIRKSRLVVQGQTFQQEFKDGDPDLVNLIDTVQKFSAGQRDFYSEIVVLMQLLIVMPASNAVSERSFSSMKLVKTYLRNRMTQERLNHLMILHVHKKLTDALDVDAVVREFIDTRDGRKLYFS